MGHNTEHEALASYNYLTQLVDPETGFTYFDVYRTSPAEAAHDWPDFLDVPGRSAETCVLLRHMTGVRVATEDLFFRRVYGFQRDDGLFHRPESRVTRDCVMLEEQALIMGALLARTIADGDPEAEDRLVRLVSALSASDFPPGPFPAMLIRPLVRTYEHLGCGAALDLARRFADRVSAEPAMFRPDGSFAGHVHSHLYAAAGLVELGRLTGDSGLVEWMDRVFLTMRARSTSFGFVPELAERDDDDVIACETCCLMDYIHLAISLTRTGRREYFDDVERALRNHLVESRVRHGEWLDESADAVDDDLILRRGLREKVLGAYGGWTAPNAMLAYDEYLPAAWIKEPSLAPVHLNKVRALQNCCSPSGPKALYLAWQHASVMEGDLLRVNLLVDRSLPEAEIRGREPHEGAVEVLVRSPIRIAFRLPAGVSQEASKILVDGAPVDAMHDDGYTLTPTIARGQRVEFVYPLQEKGERIVIGNRGRLQYEYHVSWRGSTVMRLEPGDNADTGLSHLMAEPVRLYYRAGGPHPLYQRDDLLARGLQRCPLHEAAGPGVW